MKINDKDIADLGLFLLEGHSLPSPQITNKRVSVPNRPGAYHMGSEVGVRNGIIPLGILEQSAIETQRKLREFYKECFDEYGRTKPLKIVYPFELDRYYIGRVEGMIDPIRQHEYTNMMINIVIDDPFSYSHVQAHEINWDSTIVTFDDDYSFDTVAPHDEHITQNQTVEIFVNGYAFRPKITLNGQGTNVKFSMNGKSFTVDLNGEMVIDGSNYTVTKNGVNAFDEVDDFLELLPGENQLSISGTNMDFILSIPFQDRYM